MALVGSGPRAHPEVASGRDRPGFDPEEALEVVGEVGKPDLGPGSGQADGAHELAEAVLLTGKHRLDRRADLGAGAVGFALRRRQIVAGLSPGGDLRTSAMFGQVGFVGLGAVGSVGERRRSPCWPGRGRWPAAPRHARPRW